MATRKASKKTSKTSTKTPAKVPDREKSIVGDIGGDLEKLTGVQLAAYALQGYGGEGDDGDAKDQALGFAIDALKTITLEIESAGAGQEEPLLGVLYALEQRCQVAVELLRRAKDGAS